MNVNPPLSPPFALGANDRVPEQEGKKLGVQESVDKPALSSSEGKHNNTKGKVGAINPPTGSSDKPSSIDTFDKSASQSYTATAKGLGLAAAGGALGAGIAGAAVVATKAPADRTCVDHRNVRDKPINEIPILLSHNAGTEPGSLPILATNQTMTIGETLEKTPVRGFAIDMHYRDGAPVLNHGGVFDPLVKSPPLSSALDPIAEFLDKPGNQDEVVYIMLESYLGQDGTAKALLEIEEAFGDRLFSPQHALNFISANRRLPTADELTLNGPRVMVISNITDGSISDVAFRYGWANSGFGNTWEDRSLLGSMGTALHPDIAGEFDTDEMDRLISQGGFITIDQISPNDPRFFKPEDRELLAARPDISVAGFLHVSDETANALAFGAGVTTAVGASTFGLATALYQGITHERLIRNLDKTLYQKLGQVELADLVETTRKKGASLPSRVRAADLELHCSSSLKNSLTWNTFKTGVLCTVSIASGLLGLAMLLPPAFPILAGLGIGALTLGLSVTIVASVVNRKRLNNAITRALTTPEIQRQSAAREKSLQAELDELIENQEFLREKLDQQRSSNLLHRISSFFLASTLLLRISSMAKYAMSLLGKISWIALGLVTTASTIISSVQNYRNRQKRLEKPGDTTLECVMPQVERKRFWFFGSTAFERFIEKNRVHVGAALRQEPGTELKDILRSLNHPNNKQVRQRLTLQCSMEIIQKDLRKFATKKKMALQGAQKSPDQMQKLVEEFFLERVAQAAHKDTMSAGAVNSVKLAAVVGGLGFVFPPITGVFLGIAFAVPVVGLVVSKIAAVNERKRFRKAMQTCQNLPSESPEGDLRGKLAQHQSRKLRALTKLVSEEACRSGEP